MQPEIIARRGPTVIRRMRDDSTDYEYMVRWRNQPHVREWWDPDEPDLTLRAAQRKYGARTQAESPTVACIIEVNARAIGYVQFYPWAAYAGDVRELGVQLPEGSWGLDVLIGEPESVNQGLGSDAVDMLCTYLFEHQDAKAVALWASRDNSRALRAYEKAGFQRIGEVLDTDTEDGKRVSSWVMLRERHQ